VTIRDRYRLERRLGGGGMATVHLARDVELDRPVAVKLLAEHLADDAEVRERFVREARIAARLSHPNVVAVYDAGEEDGTPYIVMECVEGETLADLLRREGRLDPDDAVALALQACAGLAHAHEAGLVHRDVKPGNLLLRRDGMLKVADFGIARAAESTRLTFAGTILGTAAYLAPEQATGEEVTAAADVYSLGAVLYECLAGRPPRRVESLADLDPEQPITPLRDVVPDVPQELEDAVMHALARRPEFRPATAAELALELGGLGETPAESPGRARRPESASSVAPIASRYRRSLRPSLGTPIAPWRRAAFHQALLDGAETPTVPLRREHRQRRRVWPALVAVLLLLLALAGAYAVAGRDTPGPPPPPARVQPVPLGGTPAEDARSLSEWLRRYSASATGSAGAAFSPNVMPSRASASWTSSRAL
jgi:eukaryotic-like serine/threonine-protein kinase